MLSVAEMKLQTRAVEVHARLEQAWQDEVFGERRTAPSEAFRERFLLNVPWSTENLDWLEGETQRGLSGVLT